MSTRRTRQIVLFAFDGVQILDVTGPMEVFAKASQAAQRQGLPAGYDIRLAGPQTGPLTASCGLTIHADAAYGDINGPIDTLLLAGGAAEGLFALCADQNFLKWLIEIVPKTRRHGSVCTGAFVLGEAGLLNGRRATTHWNSCDLLAKRYGQAIVEPDALFIRDGPLCTSAGVTAGIDLALALVEEDLGREIALDVARHLVLYLKRPGGQSQFSSALETQTQFADRVRDVVDWMNGHPDADLSVPLLAERAGMSARNFARVFKKETGCTPAQFAADLRLERAKLLLEDTGWPLARVAERTGFGSAETLRRQFHQRLGVSPDAYRSRFGLAREMST